MHNIKYNRRLAEVRNLLQAVRYCWEEASVICIEEQDNSEVLYWEKIFTLLTGVEQYLIVKIESAPKAGEKEGEQGSFRGVF
jgi:hypothetical protein